MCYQRRMSEPSRASLRRALAAGAVAALVVGSAGFALGRYTASPRGHEPAPPAAPIIALPPPALPTPTPPLGRGDLLAAARAAVSAFAASGPSPAGVAELVGRRFELRLPFGCDGPAPADTALGWRYDPDRGILRVRAVPAHLDPTVWRPGEESGVDAIEAFWIARPWTESEVCPPAGASAPTAVAEHTLGIAQFHRADDPRAVRGEGDGFEAMLRVAPEALDLSRGLRLRLTGRVASVPGAAGPFLCRAPNPAERPVCLLAVSLDRVAVENPSVDAPLATWDVAAPRAGS